MKKDNILIQISGVPKNISEKERQNLLNTIFVATFYPNNKFPREIEIIFTTSTKGGFYVYVRNFSVSAYSFQEEYLKKICNALKEELPELIANGLEGMVFLADTERITIKL